MLGSKRWLVFLGVVVSIALAVAAFSGAFLAYDLGLDSNEYIIIASLFFVATQAIFVLPIVKPPKVASKGMPLKISVLMAGFIGTTLCVIFASAVISIVLTLILGKNGEGDSWGIAPLLYSCIWIFDGGFEPEMSYPILFIFISWVIWSTLLFIFILRGKRDPSPLVKLTGWLFAGSLVELLLSIPLFLMVRRKTDCYCATGSFGALIMSVFTSLWLFGPFMVILLVWRKRPWSKDHCVHCGYPKRVSGANVCSECGIELE
ncbi:MAG: hypothetical protein ISR75_01900 [Phycisphaerales bacterium]|nr:hypothetical protein [Planctomycetota bacterium]MBL6997176.1 hypothetical protein [Phycisphaerales bacterium]